MTRPDLARVAARMLVLALVAVAALGCDDGLDGQEDPPPASGCDDVCPAELICMHGACVGALAPEWPVALRILPRSDDPLAPAEMRSIDWGGVVVRELPPLPLSARVPLQGRALVTRGGVTETIRVRSSAVALQGISAQSLTATGDIVDEADGSRFVLSVAPFWPTDAGGRRGVVYSLTLRPEVTEQYPPWRVEQLRVPADGAPIEVALPTADELPTVGGEVLFGPDNGNPVVGVRVFAVDGEGRRISTEATTDATGAFSLRFWPSEVERAVTLRVRPTVEASELPAVDTPYQVAGGGGENSFARVYLGRLQSTFELSGQITDGVEPVPGALIRMQGEVGNGTYEVSAGPTDAEGRFSATLYPGRYRLDIEPPADSPYRLVRLESDFGPADAPVYTLQPRTAIRGEVLDPGGSPIEAARVQARLTVARFADPELVTEDGPQPGRTWQSETDDGGRFVLQLDPGDHVITVTPPASTGLPVSEHPLTVPALGSDLPPVELQVPPAAALVLSLRDGDAAPAADVVVEAWRTDLDPPVRVAEATSDADGAVVLRVPMVE